MASHLAFAKEGHKVIVVGEKVIETNPWRNDRIKRQYTFAAKQALQEHHQQNPKSSVELVMSFDNGPSEGFGLAEKRDGLGVIGYLYSTESFEASQIAMSKRIPYLSPVSPLISVRNDYSYSLASSHDDLNRGFSVLQKEFDRPSFVVMPQTFLTNFEYARIYEETFDVVATFRGSTDHIWEKLEDHLRSFSKKGMVNVLLAGFLFEQMDLVQLLSQSPFAEKVNLIAHAQWNYCPSLLSSSLAGKQPRLYVVSDYFDPPMLAAHGLPEEKEIINRFANLKLALGREPELQGQSLDEPVVYVLKDMISIALDVAERSGNREEFNTNYSTLTFRGAAAVYRVNDKKTKKRIYLGKWEGNAIKPLTEL
ncbi:MAG: hypothetical protein HYW48_09070 [Deltaproteobacteria bacterium]|nr:hypothetical protein [Deltaproteobacteria bacterium]